MRIIVVEYTYKDLQVLFGGEYIMPPERVMQGDTIEYRCPYSPKCPARANCFAIETPQPLGKADILNVRCRLCGNRKIPIYAQYAAKIVKKER